MALTSIINADSVDIKALQERENCEMEIYFGVFFDGTSNNMIPAKQAREFRHRTKSADKHSYEFEIRDSSESDIVKNNSKRSSTKYSNVAILHSYYKAHNKEDGKKRLVYKIYVEGAGANDINAWNTGKPIVGLGFGLGKTGVVALVSKAVHSVKTILAAYNKDNRKNIALHFDVFGFSRGAACARLFSYLISRGDSETLPEPREAEFGKYDAKKNYQNGRLEFIKKSEWAGVSVDFLGIYDTVVSIGFLRRKDSQGNEEVNKLKLMFNGNKDFDNNYHNKNVTDYGMYSPSMNTVRSTCHICAMDEFRENFAITDIGEKIPSSSIELFLPGCHSDIGGGYVNNEDSVFDLHNKRSLQYFVSDPQMANGKTETLSGHTLLQLGWAESEKDIHEHNDSIRLKRKVPNTFCNVPLRLMIDRMSDKLKERVEIFDNSLKTIFKIPTGLNEFYNSAKQEIMSDGDRKFLYPIGGYSGNNYQTLRQNYLHFTSSEMVGVSLVNGANHISNKVCRIVYHGDKDNENMNYMYDYNKSAILKANIKS